MLGRLFPVDIFNSTIRDDGGYNKLMLVIIEGTGLGIVGGDRLYLGQPFTAAGKAVTVRHAPARPWAQISKWLCTVPVRSPMRTLARPASMPLVGVPKGCASPGQPRVYCLYLRSPSCRGLRTDVSMAMCLISHCAVSCLQIAIYALRCCLASGGLAALHRCFPSVETPLMPSSRALSLAASAPGRSSTT